MTTTLHKLVAKDIRKPSEMERANGMERGAAHQLRQPNRTEPHEASKRIKSYTNTHKTHRVDAVALH